MSFRFGYVLLVLFCHPVVADKQEYIVPQDPALMFGRNVWLQTCENCHAYGVADAPIPMQPEDWKQRVIKSRLLLYQHAIEGFIGEDYSMMPARGGNEKLSDKQVMAAVDYMLFLANYYIKQQSIKGDL